MSELKTLDFPKQFTLAGIPGHFIVRTARKEYRCRHCDDVVEPGDIYVQHSIGQGGTWRTERLHLARECVGALIEEHHEDRLKAFRSAKQLAEERVDRIVSGKEVRDDPEAVDVAARRVIDLAKRWCAERRSDPLGADWRRVEEDLEAAVRSLVEAEEANEQY